MPSRQVHQDEVLLLHVTDGSNQKVDVFRSQNIRLLALTEYVSLSAMHLYTREYDNKYRSIRLFPL